MEFQKIEPVHQGHFISRYDVTYKTVDGKEKVYEMISRDKELKTFTDLSQHKTDAVVVIVEDEERKRILLNREYRMAVGGWVYNFPAGLIDPGETPEVSAARELKEETGLDLISILDVIRDSYSAVGFSNEKNQCIVGIAGGTMAPSNSTVEEIEAAWYTKEEVRKLLKTELFAARTQAYCYLWSRLEG
ncbi:MAG: NUDIX hydrolase [Lachnospiraceae bacterium]|nr:NUDIX hydrolase [Lachnospiraceae bacterium]